MAVKGSRIHPSLNLFHFFLTPTLLLRDRWCGRKPGLVDQVPNRRLIDHQPSSMSISSSSWMLGPVDHWLPHECWTRRTKNPAFDRKSPIKERSHQHYLTERKKEGSMLVALDWYSQNRKRGKFLDNFESTGIYPPVPQQPSHLKIENLVLTAALFFLLLICGELTVKQPFSFP